MANRYWVGGAGTWNTASTANWSASSGGASGASAPTAADDVFFDQAGTYTVTVTGGLCRDITVSASTITFSLVTTGPTISGSMSLVAGTVWSGLPGTTFNATTTGKTITTNGVNLSSGMTLDGVGGGWTLGSAYSGTSAGLTINRGSFDSANYAISASTLTSSNITVRSINLGSSTVTLSGNTVNALNVSNTSNLTWNAGTSQINLTGGTTTGINSGGLTFYNVSFATANPSITITGNNTFNNLSFAGRSTIGISTITISGNQTVNGTLTLSGAGLSAGRTFITSDAIGTQRTLTVNALAAGASDYDFRDIAITGAAAPIAPTRAGDCKGNSGITFPAAKTVYYRSSGSTQWGVTGSSAWSLTNGGAADVTAFPLAQDTAFFPSSPTPYPSSGVTSTINANYNIGTIDMSARTSNTMTLATGTTTPTIYGNWINGTGTTLTGTGRITFAGRTTQQITSAGKTFTQPITINTPNGAVTLQDAAIFNISSAGVLTLTAGTFDCAIYNLTLSSTGTSGLTVTGSNTRTFAFGSGTTTFAGLGTTWDASTSTNLTVTGTGTINLTSASAKSFSGGGIQTYPTLNQGGTGALTITGSNKFAAMTNTAIGSVLFTGGTTNEFTSSFSLNGSAVSSLTLSSTNTTQAILKKPSAWLMGLLSTNAGNNTGLTFVASDGTMEYLTVSYINGQTTVTYTGAGNFFPFFS